MEEDLRILDSVLAVYLLCSVCLSPLLILGCIGVFIDCGLGRRTTSLPLKEFYRTLSDIGSVAHSPTNSFLRMSVVTGRSMSCRKQYSESSENRVYD